MRVLDVASPLLGPKSISRGSIGSFRTSEITSTVWGPAQHFRTFHPAALASLAVLLPPLPAQRRIVGILDEAFDGIATAKANTEKNLQNAQAVFESHLNAVFTERGEAWVEKRLVDIAKVFGRGKSRHRPRNEPSLYGGKYPFVQTGDIRNADHVIDSYTQTYINMGTFEDQRFPFPSIAVQQKIVATLDSLRNETQNLQSIYRRKLAGLDELEKSLLDQAFSGEL